MNTPNERLTQGLVSEKATDKPDRTFYARPDDFSCNPRNWSLEKLLKEKPNGMPAVAAEYERRIGGAL